jgi:hypothetical protein
MVTMRIQEEFRARAIIRCGTLLLKPADAIEMVRRCRERGIEVSGIDGFRLTETTTQPLLDEILDLQTEDDKYRHRCWEEAERFLRERMQTDLYFEVAYDDTRDPF